MKFEVKDVARMLDLPKATIERWIRQGKIPARLENGKYVFYEKQLKAWARTHNITLRESEGTQQVNDEDSVTLFDALRRGGMLDNVEGSNVEEVLRAAVERMNLPVEIDKESLVERLLQREELASTGIGEGVAIPHPRLPMEGFSLKAWVTICFLKKEIDFNSVDGKPVFVMFIMLSSTTKIHLRLLSRLSYCLRNQDFLEMLRARPRFETLLDKVKELEDQL